MQLCYLLKVQYLLLYLCHWAACITSADLVRAQILLTGPNNILWKSAQRNSVMVNQGLIKYGCWWICSAMWGAHVMRQVILKLKLSLYCNASDMITFYGSPPTARSSKPVIQTWLFHQSQCPKATLYEGGGALSKGIDGEERVRAETSLCPHRVSPIRQKRQTQNTFLSPCDPMERQNKRRKWLELWVLRKKQKTEACPESH